MIFKQFDLKSLGHASYLIGSKTNGEVFMLDPLLERDSDLWEACWEMLRIGYDLPQGWLAGGMQAWRAAAKPIETLEQWNVWQLQEQIEKNRDLVVLDVRQPAEWNAGHIHGATYIIGAKLPEKIDQLPKDRRVAVICGSGHRSSVAASPRLRAGNRMVINVLGGMTAWKRAGFKTAADEAAA